MKLLRKLLAFTLIELLVVISIIAILASLAIPAVTGALVRGQMTQTLNNQRQLTLATQSLALDSFTAGEGDGWPNPGSPFNTWAGNLVGGKYMEASDLAKMLSAPGVNVPAPPGNSTNITLSRSAMRVYGVGESAPGSAIFISTYNYEAKTGAGTLSANLQPYGDKGFVIFRKGGDGQAMQPRFATNTNLGATNQGTYTELSGNPGPGGTSN